MTERNRCFESRPFSVARHQPILTARPMGRPGPEGRRGMARDGEGRRPPYLPGCPWVCSAPPPRTRPGTIRCGHGSCLPRSLLLRCSALEARRGSRQRVGSGAPGRSVPEPSARPTQLSTRGPGEHGRQSARISSPLRPGGHNAIWHHRSHSYSVPALGVPVETGEGTGSACHQGCQGEKWGDRSPPRTEGTRRWSLPVPSWGGSKGLGLPDLSQFGDNLSRSWGVSADPLFCLASRQEHRRQRAPARQGRAPDHMGQEGSRGS